MANRTFLNPQELNAAEKELQAPEFQFHDGALNSISNSPKNFSLWLGDQLQKKMESAPGWEDSEPVALGSWAREELCACSDIDLLFCGKKKAVKSVVDHLQLLGFRIRYRMPEDAKDWTQGVAPFDVLAILHGKAFHWRTVEKLVEQQTRIEESGEIFKKSLFTAMKKERKERAQRYDNISNFLEPNLKYGTGGLRDLQQALSIHQLYPDRFQDSGSIFQSLTLYKNFLMSIRHKLHLNSGAEVLSAQDQLEIARWMKFKDHAQFMKTLQMGLSEVSFFADWSVAQVGTSKKQVKVTQSLRLTSLISVFRFLNKDSSILNQAKIRENLDSLFCNKISSKIIGRHLNSFFRVQEDLTFLDSLFSSKLLEYCVPHLHRVQGLSQHDHYHRFTVNEHIRQCVKTIKKVYDNPKLLGKLAPFVKEMKDSDWKILIWSGLYHDIAKGLGGDHSSSGADIVKEEFVNMGLSLRHTVEVAWMVQNHLILSTAAFRMNPQESSTWKRLYDYGVKGIRLYRLAIFTAVDIIATNPDAWSPWKEELLFDLVNVVSDSKARNFMSLLQLAEKSDIALSGEFAKTLDPFVIENLPVKTLLADYKSLKEANDNLPLKVVSDNEGRIWVRFHRMKDEKGLFFKFVSWLYAAGCRVNQSSINTFDKYGVYDWFHVRSNKKPQQLKKLIEILQNQNQSNPIKATFESLEVMPESEGQYIVSLRGKDKKGLLVSAARVFHEANIRITWAKVHTWGRQIEDVFMVRSKMSQEQLESVLRDRLIEERIVPLPT